MTDPSCGETDKRMRPSNTCKNASRESIISPPPPPTSSHSTAALFPDDDRGENSHGSTSKKATGLLLLSRDLLDHLQIAIIGTGLAGLSTAISLEQVGYRNITLYERDVGWGARQEGYGLTLTYDPRGILNALGVLDEIANADCPSRSHYLFDPNGAVQGYFGNAFHTIWQQQQQQQQVHGNSSSPAQQQQQSPLWQPQMRRGVGQRGNLRVPRQTVRKILMDQLQHSTIEWNHKVVDVVPYGNDDKVELVFETVSPPPSNGIREEDADQFFTQKGRRRREESPAQRTHRCRRTTRRGGVLVDLVVAADGIRSTVVQKWIPRVPAPSSLEVRIILGISQGFVHPLLDERGFYSTTTTAVAATDNNNTIPARLFVMPFAGSRLDSIDQRRFMWQLSFSTAKGNRHNGGKDQEDDDDDESTTTVYYSNEVLLQQAMTMCQHWHDPVPALIAATPVSTVWGTRLYDRDPSRVYEELKRRRKQQSDFHRVLVVGDALHAMSPFKGQGANQALQDGRVVAQWLDPNTSDTSNNSKKKTTTKSKNKSKNKTKKLDKAVLNCVRELAQRTQGVVRASREASQFWHGSVERLFNNLQDNRNVSKNDDTGEDRAAACNGHHRPKKPLSYDTHHFPKNHFKFAGLSEQSTEKLLQLLEERQIYAGKCNDLDQAIAQVLLEHKRELAPNGWMDGFQLEADENQKNRVGETLLPSKHDLSEQVVAAQQSPEAQQPAAARWKEKVWEATQQGDLGRLRRLSWEGQQRSVSISTASTTRTTTTTSCTFILSELRDTVTGDTPLHVAVQTRQSNHVLTWLVREAGCDLQARNQMGLTPIDLAATPTNKQQPHDESTPEQLEDSQQSLQKFLHRLLRLQQQEQSVVVCEGNNLVST
ncbi:hypothetical protein ACA910_003017 [Epithemia clementina (nom. ined.)]